MSVNICTNIFRYVDPFFYLYDFQDSSNLKFNITAWFFKTPTCRRKQKALELELEKLNEANELQKKKGGK